MGDISKWDIRFMGLAKLVASWSKDPSTQCGAVIADGKRIVSVGFNGFPQGTDDSEELYENRGIKLTRIIHAEQNAMAFTFRSLLGCTMYVHPMPPCAQCAAMIIQRGVTRVVSGPPMERWMEEFQETERLFSEAGVELVIMQP